MCAEQSRPSRSGHLLAPVSAGAHLRAVFAEQLLASLQSPGMESVLSPARQEFVRRLYAAYEEHAAAALEERREQHGRKADAASHIRGLAERIVAGTITADEFRQQSETLAREYPHVGFMGLSGQMFVNQHVYAARDVER